MSERQIAYALIIIGVVVALASLLVDVVGVGSEGFGSYQTAGLIVGIVVAVIGLYLRYVRQRPAV